MKPLFASAVCLLLTATLLASTARAAQIDSLTVTLEDGRYHLVAQTHLDATPGSIYKVLLDYDHDAYGRISDIYKESGYLAPAPDGTPLVYTRVEGCLLFFCRSMRRVERLEAVKPTFIRTTALPDRSDFKYSRSEWRLKPEAGGTHVTYRLVMQPDFWLPPFVGPAFLKHVLMHGGVHAVEHIETLARQLDRRAATTAAAPAHGGDRDSAPSGRAEPVASGGAARAAAEVVTAKAH